VLPLLLAVLKKGRQIHRVSVRQSAFGVRLRQLVFGVSPRPSVSEVSLGQSASGIRRDVSTVQFRQ
jgi:hypothetical protein